MKRIASALGTIVAWVLLFLASAVIVGAWCAVAFMEFHWILGWRP